MGREYLMVFHDWPEKTDHLPDDARGRLITALVRYSRGEEINYEGLKGPERYVFPVFKSEVDRAIANYNEISTKRREAGSAGGKQTQAKRANQANAIICNQEEDKEDEENEEENEEEKEDIRITARSALTVEGLQSYYHKQFKRSTLPKEYIAIWQNRGMSLETIKACIDLAKAKNPRQDFEAFKMCKTIIENMMKDKA